MAGVVGQGARRRRPVKTESAPTTLDPIEIAMEAEVSDPSPDSPARRVLLGQEALIGEQIALAQHDLRLRRWQIVGERASVALKVLTAMAGLAVAGAAALMIWTASRAEGLVVAAFSVPPDLAQSGLSGEVVASRVLDRIVELTRSTDSGRPASTFSDDWSRDVRIEIPQTSISFGELDRTLRSLLGHETRLTGSVYRTPQGITLVARTGPGAATAVSGQDLDQLIDETATRLFALTQPYRYAVALSSRGEPQAALAIFDRLGARGTPQERAWAQLQRASIFIRFNQPGAARSALDEALRLDPSNSTVVWTMATLEGRLGHLEEVYRLLRKAKKGYAAGGGVTPLSAVQRVRTISAQMAFLEADYIGAASLWSEVAKDPPVGIVIAPKLQQAEALALAHDPRGAQRLFDQFAGTAPPIPVLRAVPAAIALANHDWTAMLGDPAGPGPPPHVRAIALARLGRLAEARAVLAPTALNDLRALAARGAVAYMSGDRAAGEHWFREAARLSPSLSLAYLAWGDARLEGGDAAGAIEAYLRAAKLSPASPDVLHGLGRALARQGQLEAASSKFAEAARIAPWWGTNHLDWGETLARAGRRPEAATQARAARATGVPLDQAARLEALIALTS